MIEEIWANFTVIAGRISFNSLNEVEFPRLSAIMRKLCAFSYPYRIDQKCNISGLLEVSRELEDT